MDINGLRWHKLTSISRGAVEIEVMGATCIDGIGVIVRWSKRPWGWASEALDTEGCKWESIDFREEGNEIPPTPPTVWDDIDKSSVLGYKGSEHDLKETGYFYAPYIPLTVMEFKPEGGFDCHEIDTRIKPSNWLPHPAHPRDLYYEAHKKCPICDSKNHCQTLMGFVFDMQHPELFKDKNRVNCSCGWVGFVHDLT